MSASNASPHRKSAAQVNPYKTGTPGVTGYRSEVLAEVMIQEDKLVRLAEAIPADKYTWRPAPDVRSFSEVFLHIAAANYSVYKLVGTPAPDGLDVKNLDKSTIDKSKVIATLKDSFAHARQAISAMPDANLDKSLDWFGGKNTQRGVLLFVTRHTSTGGGAAAGGGETRTIRKKRRSKSRRNKPRKLLPNRRSKSEKLPESAPSSHDC